MSARTTNVLRRRPAVPSLVTAILLLAAPAVAAEGVEIKLGTLAPKGSTWEQMMKEMAQKWSEASDGQVRVRIYPSGVLGTEGDMVRKLRVGQIGAAALTVIGLHDITPEPQVISAPLMIESYEELDYVMSKVQGELEKTITNKGFVVLTWGEVGFVHFFSTKPFRTVAEARSAKVFAWEGDPASIDAWKAAGFNPVVLAATDILPALQTGLVDTDATSPLYAYTARFFQKANHMLDLKWAVLLGATVVRKEVWEKVKPDLRPRLIEIARAYGRRMALDVRRMNEDAVQKMVQQGLTVEKAADMPGWVEAARRANEVVRGKVVPAAIYDAVIRVRDEYRKRGEKNK